MEASAEPTNQLGYVTNKLEESIQFFHRKTNHNRCMTTTLGVLSTSLSGRRLWRPIQRIRTIEAPIEGARRQDLQIRFGLDALAQRRFAQPQFLEKPIRGDSPQARHQIRHMVSAETLSLLD
jgi:hypothetical protein